MNFMSRKTSLFFPKVFTFQHKFSFSFRNGILYIKVIRNPIFSQSPTKGLSFSGRMTFCYCTFYCKTNFFEHLLSILIENMPYLLSLITKSFVLTSRMFVYIFRTVFNTIKKQNKTPELPAHVTFHVRL